MEFDEFAMNVIESLLFALYITKNTMNSWNSCNSQCNQWILNQCLSSHPEIKTESNTSKTTTNSLNSMNSLPIQWIFVHSQSLSWKTERIYGIRSIHNEYCRQSLFLTLYHQKHDEFVEFLLFSMQSMNSKSMSMESLRNHNKKKNIKNNHEFVIFNEFTSNTMDTGSFLNLYLEKGNKFMEFDQLKMNISHSLCFLLSITRNITNSWNSCKAQCHQWILHQYLSNSSETKPGSNISKITTNSLYLMKSHQIQWITQKPEKQWMRSNSQFLKRNHFSIKIYRDKC